MNGDGDWVGDAVPVRFVSRFVSRKSVVDALIDAHVPRPQLHGNGKPLNGTYLCTETPNSLSQTRPLFVWYNRK